MKATGKKQERKETQQENKEEKKRSRKDGKKKASITIDGNTYIDHTTTGWRREKGKKVKEDMHTRRKEES